MMYGKIRDVLHNSCLSLMHSFFCTQTFVWLDVDRTGLINSTFICLIVDFCPPNIFV